MKPGTRVIVHDAYGEITNTGTVLRKAWDHNGEEHYTVELDQPETLGPLDPDTTYASATYPASWLTKLR
jgi:hypothetical protein